VSLTSTRCVLVRTGIAAVVAVMFERRLNWGYHRNLPVLSSAVEVFAVQLYKAVRQPLQPAKDAPALEPVRDLAILPIPRWDSRLTPEASEDGTDEWVPAWKLTLTLLHITRVCLLGIVREIKFSRACIRLAIDDGTGVAKAQCWNSPEGMLQGAGDWKQGTRSALQTGVVLYCSGRVNWHEGNCICIVDELRVFPPCKSAAAEMRWWRRVIERQRELARQYA